MSRSFPDLNLEWLIHGKGRMYRDGRKEAAPLPQNVEGQLFAAVQEEAPAPQAAPEPAPEAPATPDSPAPVQPAEKKSEQVENKHIFAESPKAALQPNGRRITRIVVFYDDNTYQELREA